MWASTIDWIRASPCSRLKGCTAISEQGLNQGRHGGPPGRRISASHPRDWCAPALVLHEVGLSCGQGMLRLFQVGVQQLKRIVRPAEAGGAYSDIAQATISADRRYVRLSLSPVFNTVTGFRTTPVINNPLLPGGPAGQLP